MLSGKGNEMLNLTDMPRCAKANDSGRRNLRLTVNGAKHLLWFLALD